MLMAKRVKRRASRRSTKLFDETRGRAGETITGERNLRDQRLFLLSPFRCSGLWRRRLLVFGFLTFRLPALNNLWHRPFRNLGATAGPSPFTHPFFRLLVLAFWGIAVLSEEDFDGPIANILDVVVVSWTQRSGMTACQRCKHEVTDQVGPRNTLLDKS